MLFVAEARKDTGHTSTKKSVKCQIFLKIKKKEFPEYGE